MLSTSVYVLILSFYKLLDDLPNLAELKVCLSWIISKSLAPVGEMRTIQVYKINTR